MCNSAHLFHVQNFKLEGLFLSKAKKIISMLLVVAMVLTVAPASMIASAYESNYTHGKLTFSKVNFTVDTSATTKVIRVAKAGTFQYGTDIISATPSGIPAHTGRYSALLMQAKRRPIRRSSLRSRARRSTKPRRSPRIRRAPFSSVQWTCLSRMVIPTPTL